MEPERSSGKNSSSFEHSLNRAFDLLSEFLPEPESERSSDKSRVQVQVKIQVKRVRAKANIYKFPPRLAKSTIKIGPADKTKNKAINWKNISKFIHFNN